MTADAWDELRDEYDSWFARRSAIELTPEAAYALLAEHEAAGRPAGRRVAEAAGRVVLTLLLVAVLATISVALTQHLQQW